MQGILRSMDDVALTGKRVIVREDLNVPMAHGRVTNNERILRALPTIKKAIAANARTIILSHLGRPTEGKFDETYSLAPVAQALTEALGQPVQLVQNWLEHFDVAPGQVVLAENVRFNVGEQSNDRKLARQMASLCDVFVMDAFATAHRAQASTVGIAEFAAQVCAGPLLLTEIKCFIASFKSPAKAIGGYCGWLESINQN